MKQNERTITEWYVETAEDFWSGQWEGSDAAFVIGAIFFPLLFLVPFYWTDIIYVLAFARDVVMQPVYGGSVLIFFLRMVVHGGKKSGVR